MAQIMKLYEKNLKKIQVIIKKSQSPTIRKYKSCRVTLNNRQSQDFGLPKNIPTYLPTHKSCQRRALPKKNTVKNLRDNILLSLTYKQKLNNIQHILSSCKQFSEKYGYFYLTQPMISFNKEKKNLECWIHPDKRSKKPLHPIRNLQNSKSKNLFYSQIKNLLKKLFPTISQPTGNSYIDLLINIRRLKKKINDRFKRNNSVNKFSQQKKIKAFTRIYQINQPQDFVQPPLFAQQNESIIQNEQDNYSIVQTPRYTRNLQKAKDQYPKNTISTLIQSLRSSQNLNQFQKANEKVKIYQNETNNIKQILESVKFDVSSDGELNSKILSQFQGLLRSRQISRDLMLQTVSEEIQNILSN